MTNKKEDKKPHEKNLEEYYKKSELVKKFTDSTTLKHHKIISDVLNDKELGLLDERGLIDYTKLKMDDKDKSKTDKLYHKIADAIMKKAKSEFTPMIEKTYGLKLDGKKGDDIFRDHFFEQFFGIHKDSIYEMFAKHQDKFDVEVYKNDIMKKHLSSLKNNLRPLAMSSIKKDDISELVKKFGIDKHMKADRLKELNDNKYVEFISAFADLYKETKNAPIEYSQLTQFNENYKEQRGQDLIGGYLLEHSKRDKYVKDQKKLMSKEYKLKDAA